MAKCQGCKEDLTEENSSLSVVNRGRGKCRSCARLRQKEFRRNNPKSFLLYASRQRSKTRGYENTLVLEDIPEIPEYCPVFPWIKLEHQVGTQRRDSSPSLDRIDNTKGYVKGNVRVISWRANHVKGEATDQELAALGLDATKRNKRRDNARRREESRRQNLVAQAIEKTEYSQVLVSNI